MSRAWALSQNETDSAGRKRETSGEGELSILSTWAFIDNPMAEGEVKRGGTAYRLDPPPRSLLPSRRRTRWRIYTFLWRMNARSFRKFEETVTMFRNARCEIEWKPNGNDTMKNSSRWLETLCLSWDNIDCIYIFCLFAEIYIHIYVLL